MIVPPEVFSVIDNRSCWNDARPNALLKARNDCQFTVLVTSVRQPPRKTVRPLPKVSHAKPTRGPKFLWSRL